MPLTLRPNEFDTLSRRDYSVIEKVADGAESVIGRIYAGAGRRGDKWLYAINGWGSDLADDLEDAKARFKSTWLRRKYGQPPGATHGKGN